MSCEKFCFTISNISAKKGPTHISRITNVALTETTYTAESLGFNTTQNIINIKEKK